MRAINFYRTASVLLFYVTACHRPAPGDQVPSPERSSSLGTSLTIEEKETYAVYDAVLSGSGPNAHNSRDVIAIRDHTKTDRTCADLSETIDPRLILAQRDLAKRSSQEQLLQASEFDLGRPVKMIPSTELDHIFDSGIMQGWTTFRNQYGVQGFTMLSAVGFTPGKNFAVVYRSVSCGGLCGNGAFVTLSKKGGKWTVNKDVLCRWIS